MYGPYAQAPSTGGGYNNTRMEATDGYKQIYGSKMHRRFIKNPAKAAFKLFAEGSNVFRPYVKNTHLQNVAYPEMLLYFLVSHTGSTAPN